MILERDNSGVAHVVALSGGKDSTAMALRLKMIETGSRYNYICTPTGDESPEMFEHWRNLSLRLGAPIWPITAGTLESVMSEERAIPNHRMRFCTRRLKIEPYMKFCQANKPAISYVGLRADEQDREGITQHGADLSIPRPFGIEQRYPLREWGWGLKQVLQFLEEQGVTIPDRTDCERCFWQRIGEWYLLWKNRREKFNRAAHDEEVFGHTWRSPGRDSWPVALTDLAREFESGRVPELSLKMMEKRKGMCRACTL